MRSELKTSRKDTDDGVSDSAQGDILPDDVAAAMEAALPSGKGDESPVSAGIFVGATKFAA